MEIILFCGIFPPKFPVSSLRTGSRCQERMVLCFGTNDKEKTELALKSVAMRDVCMEGII